jgi:Family of unknown function (DUF6114)/zinc-ribbon domain
MCYIFYERTSIRHVLPGEKPTAAMVLSLIGGIFVLIGGALLAAAGGILSSLAIVGGGLVTAFGIVGVVFGILMIVGAVMMYTNPASHTMWGVIVLVLSILSWVFAIGGIFIGFLLGLIGGILALVFKPSMGPTMMPGQPYGTYPTGQMGQMGMNPPPMGQPTGQMGMFCKNCGASIPAGAAKCPSCGASVM